LFAKAGVFAAMYGLQKDAEPTDDERIYIRFFAGEVLDFLAAYHQVGEWSAGGFLTII
jgi:hypothetical protein